MTTVVDRQQVLRLIGEGAQIVEVLPRNEYDEEHLPEAVHLPLKELGPSTTGVLDKSQAVIVYCWDGL